VPCSPPDLLRPELGKRSTALLADPRDYVGLKRLHIHRHAEVAGRFQMASGTGSGRGLRSMNSRKSLTVGHGRANRRMLSAFLAAFSVTRMAIWIRLPSMLPSNVPMYRPDGTGSTITEIASLRSQ